MCATILHSLYLGHRLFNGGTVRKSHLELRQAVGHDRLSHGHIVLLNIECWVK